MNELGWAVSSAGGNITYIIHGCNKHFSMCSFKTHIENDGNPTNVALSLPSVKLSKNWQHIIL